MQLIFFLETFHSAIKIVLIFDLIVSFHAVILLLTKMNNILSSFWNFLIASSSVVDLKLLHVMELPKSRSNWCFFFMKTIHNPRNIVMFILNMFIVRKLCYTLHAELLDIFLKIMTRRRKNYFYFVASCNYNQLIKN